ncbi:MAG: hypothetical protein FJ304_09105 [Planctomycetes bacterium]|nr:hypothetical protein [Planctomycetota bacterium]
MTPELLQDREATNTADADRARPVADLPTAQIAVAGSDAGADGSAEPVRFATPTWVRKSDESVSADPYPRIGEFFDGFQILSELGRGAMGRVYLAQQQAPTTRVVVLKVGQHLSSECQKLAKLQHPNIVPVYSFHEDGSRQAVCMPYRGPLTLAHVVARLRSENLQTLDGYALTTAIEECRKDRQTSVVLSVRPTAETAAPEPEAPEAGPTQFVELRGLNHVDAVLTIARQVVEGLRVAHEARIVHSDLKPANVLIADDGCAQLLDFGVAYDKSDLNATRLRLGGTRPYMSPEQLKSLATSALEYDERSDLYAVGVMVYELLTGRVPFAPDLDPSPAAMERERETRFAPPPPVRSLNPRVPPAVAAIIGKCLEPDIADRYQTAAQLLEDMDRQLARRRLRYAPNTSGRELVAKWLTRNRVLLAVAGVLSAAGALSAGFIHRDSKRTEDLRRLEMVSAGEPFAADRDEAEFYFGLADGDRAYRERAWATARRALDRFQAWDDADWFRRDAFQNLPADRADGYRRQVAGLMLLLSNSRAQEGARATDAAHRENLLREAREWNQRAEATHPTPEGCRAVWAQRGFITRLGGDHAGAERHARRAEAIRRDAADAVLEGRQFMTEGRIQAALLVLTEATKSDPKNFWAVFYASVCQQMLGDLRQAAAGYDICLSLRPGFFGTYYNRGQTRMRTGPVADAEADFDKALEARPDWADAHFQRAITREARKNYTGALDDLNKALELGYTPTSVYLVRSRVYGRMGDKKAEAQREFAEGIKTVPTDVRGWLARAQAQLYRDPQAALADYEQALKLNPRLIPALQGKAHLLSTADRNEEAAKALSLMIDINPDTPDAWAGRGVLRARLNDRDGALKDAREALRLTERPATKYQVAGIYAMTSRAHPEDRREAFSLLDSALRDGFGFEYLDKDKELDPIRTDPEFKKIVDAARAYRNALKKVD